MGDIGQGEMMSKTTETSAVDARTVLVIEDSPTQALHLQALLEQEGLNVVLAEDGRVGLEVAQRLQPDLIVLDLQMPEMNGFQVCRRLKDEDRTSYIPVIMFTRHDDREAVVLGLQLGAVDYIPKDAFADAVLLETLRQMGLIAPSAA
jgi:DNA-binding response OmpR family regulator